MERNITHEMNNDFNIDDFGVNTTQKYKSCTVYTFKLSSDTLTEIYKNGWKFISMAAYNKKTELGETFAIVYMFENMNFNSDTNGNNKLFS